MPAFDHVVLARFNVRFQGQSPPGENWLLYRWGFFREALAASVARQTVRDLTWLVFFDRSTPGWLRDEIDGLSPGLFTPVFLDEAWSLAAVQREVLTVTSADYVITTRIDSDDAIATRFIEEVQSHFAHQRAQYINLLCGVQVDRRGWVYRVDFDCNPFISYIEKLEPDAAPRTVFQSFRHGDSQYHGSVLNVVSPPRWMQVVHGGNLANNVRGPRMLPRTITQNFDHDLQFTTSINPVAFVAQWAVSIMELAASWVRRPRQLLAFVRGRRLRLQGTQVLPQLPLPQRMVSGR